MLTANFMNDTFAVVDLETTGTQREKNNHIIQFGCALIKKRRVVQTYSFMIDPHRSIPLSVQNLTGIHQQDVSKAHDFSYFAPRIIKILHNTVFVAHNVNFDLPFLNYELMEHGFEALTNKAIDTVELAKIAFPTLPSYKLSDLTARLHIKHLNPHKADSDAYGTAILLLKIIKQLEKLPQATLNTLSSLSHGLVRDTSWVFTTIAANARTQKRPLSKNYIQVRNIVLQRQEINKAGAKGKDVHFPLADQKKKSLFKGHLHYRQAQVDLINHIHSFVVSQDQRAMLIEAPNGTGKTFSYLFSYAYQLYSGRKLVIAVPTKVLQEQVLQQEIPQLLTVTHLDLTAQAVKSASHYIDLDGFVQNLFKGTPNKPTLVLEMQILVWLTQTKTGDLDELQLTNYKAPLFSQISHPGDARVGSHFAEVDFWNLARQRQEQADILVTNHAYLANHYTDTIWGQNPYLVIDEAHRFADNVISSRNDALRFESLWGTISHLRNLLFYADDSLTSQFADDLQLNYLLKQLDSSSLVLIHLINELQKNLYQQKKTAVNRQILPNGNLELSFQGKGLFPSPALFLQKLARFQKQLESVRQQTDHLLFTLFQTQNDALTDGDDLVSELTNSIDALDYYTEKSYQLADLINKDKELGQEGFILVITNPEDPLSTNLEWLMLDVSQELQHIYERFAHLLFVSATLTSNGSFEYAIHQLALAKLKPVTFIGKSTFSLAQHLRAYAVSDMPDPSSQAYEDELVKILTRDLGQARHILILMTNLDKIHDIFTAIVNKPQLKDFEILAQGLSGSNHRIAKRFGLAQRAIILGADSFWEGIDFHNCAVDLVIATKLPFESPAQPEVRLRQQKLADEGIDVFRKDTIPRAVLRLRQGIGRLIRGEQDYGQFVILDSRLWTKNYGADFLRAIPVKVSRIKRKDLKGKLNHDQ